MKNRQLYQQRWVRQESKNLNQELIRLLKDYKTKLTTAQLCDLGIKESVSENIRFFELYVTIRLIYRFALSREALKDKIPVKTDTSALKNSEEAKGLQAALDDLEKLKVGILAAITKTFQKLNDDNIVPLMIAVIKKTTTETAVINDNKPKYGILIEEVEKLSKEIKEIKNTIKIKNESFLQLKKISAKPNEQNEKVFIFK